MKWVLYCVAGLKKHNVSVCCEGEGEGEGRQSDHIPLMVFRQMVWADGVYAVLCLVCLQCLLAARCPAC